MSNSPLAVYTRVSPNKTKRQKKICKITPHHMAGNLSVEDCGSIFAYKEREASANYGIGTDGRVAMYVPEDYRAWTSSDRDNDEVAITIEVANDGGAPEWHVSDRALATLIDLCVDICKRNDIDELVYTGDAKGNLTRHNMFDATTCPGPYLQSKFPYIAKEVNKRLGAVNTQKVAKYYVQVGAYSELRNAENMVAKLKAAGFDAIIKNEEDETVKEPDAENVKEVTFKEGDLVKMQKDAPVYGWNAKFQDWVYDSTLFVRDVAGNRIVVSTVATGPITGAVDKKYLTKV